MKPAIKSVLDRSWVRTLMRLLLSLFLALSAIASVAPTLRAQSSSAVKRDLAWFSPGDEIDTARFSPDGAFVLLVTRSHWPDGHEAEGLPDAYFKKLEEKKNQDPRFADPVIKLVSLSGSVVCEVRYGWNPSVSSDNKRIVLSEQVKPITGFRVLAEAQAGNGIRIFDCDTKQLSNVAVPENGYLDDPLFLAGEQSVLYTENEAVNGSYGGAVGLGLWNPSANEKPRPLSKQTTEAVPCPPSSSAEQTYAAYACSHIPQLTSAFPRLIQQVARADKDVLALVEMPIPAPGDVYLAREYEVALVSVLPEFRKILSFGKKSMGDLDEVGFQVVSGEQVLVFSQYWKLLSVSGEPLPDPGPQNRMRKSIYSPDLKYYLCQNSDEDPTRFLLYRTADGMKIFSMPKMASVFEAVWSPDSKHFAVIGLPVAVRGSKYHDELDVYSVQ